MRYKLAHTSLSALLERILHRLLGGAARSGVLVEVERPELGRRAVCESVAEVAHPLVADLVSFEVELLERGRCATREGVPQVAHPLVTDLVTPDGEVFERGCRAAREASDWFSAYSAGRGSGGTKDVMMYSILFLISAEGGFAGLAKTTKKN